LLHQVKNLSDWGGSSRMSGTPGGGGLVAQKLVKGKESEKKFDRRSA